MSLYDEYNQMVADLAKPGEDILSTLTPEKCHLWHMASCIPPEADEVIEGADTAFSAEYTTQKEFDDAKAALRINLIEELGDIAFYTVGCLQFLGLDINERLNITNTVGDESYWDVEFAVKLLRLNIVSGLVFDAAKRHVIYAKEGWTEEKLVEALDKLIVGIHNVAQSIDSSLEDVLNANMEKLLKGDTARYKSGSYSDEQANARSDKA